MNTLIISFSLRQNSNSLKVAEHLKTKTGGKILDLQEINLSMWGIKTDVWNQIKPRLEQADSYIFVIPEYCGSPSPSYFNFCMFLGSEVAHKPVLLVSVSSGRGGSYPIIGARAFGYKNSKINYIPEHLIFRNVEEEDYKTGFMDQKTDYILGIFAIYETNFVQIRKQIVLNPSFANGM